MDLFRAPENAIFITYAAIISAASACVFIGSKMSLHTPLTETLTQKDAYKFPFIASGTLFGLYMLLRYLHKEYVNLLLSIYFLFFGVTALAATFAPAAYFLFGGQRNRKLKLSLPYVGTVADTTWGWSDLVALAAACAVCYYYVLTKHWMASNLFGISLCIQGIAVFSLGTYKNGAILLLGLFVYDIFWVFGTEVMVSVAKNIDLPIKLLFPRNIFASVYEFSMLGLGDIIIPGWFVAMLLRFDKKHQTPLFVTNFVAYVLGLVATIFVMHTFKAAQPALLYLVPFCLGASVLVAIPNGVFSQLLEYSEEDKQGKKNKKTKQN